MISLISGRDLASVFLEGAEDQGVGLRILMSVIRYAAERIAKDLAKKGGRLVAKPEGFIVENKEGPLKPGELERTNKWAKGMNE